MKRLCIRQENIELLKIPIERMCELAKAYVTTEKSFLLLLDYSRSERMRGAKAHKLLGLYYLVPISII